MTTTDRDDDTSRDDAVTGNPAEASGDGLPSDPEARKFIWRDSPQYKRFTRRRRQYFIVNALVAIVSCSFYLLSLRDENRSWQEMYIRVAIVSILLLWLIVVGAFVLEWRARQTFEARVRLGMARKIGDNEKELARSAKDGQLDLASLWALNQERIEYYHGIARTQAESSYRMALIAGVVGFFAVLGLGALAAFATSGTASIAAAAVGVAGAAMSAYIGATFMKIQAEASSQFRQFFREPVEVSRLLSAERLINTLGDEGEKAKAVQIVVSAMMTPEGSKGSEST